GASLNRRALETALEMAGGSRFRGDTGPARTERAGVSPTEVGKNAHRSSSQCRRKPQEKHMERNEINDVASTSLSHLIGQRSLVEQVRVALDAAQMDGLPFPSTLCVGAAGCGKTQTAKVVAAEMGSEFHEVLGQAIQSPADFNALLQRASDKD